MDLEPVLGMPINTNLYLGEIIIIFRASVTRCYSSTHKRVIVSNVKNAGCRRPYHHMISTLMPCPWFQWVPATHPSNTATSPNIAWKRLIWLDFRQIGRSLAQTASTKGSRSACDDDFPVSWLLSPHLPDSADTSPWHPRGRWDRLADGLLSGRQACSHVTEQLLNGDKHSASRNGSGECYAKSRHRSWVIESNGGRLCPGIFRTLQTDAANTMQRKKPMMTAAVGTDWSIRHNNCWRHRVAVPGCSFPLRAHYLLLYNQRGLCVRLVTR